MALRVLQQSQALRLCLKLGPSSESTLGIANVHRPFMLCSNTLSWATPCAQSAALFRETRGKKKATEHDLIQTRKWIPRWCKMCSRGLNFMLSRHNSIECASETLIDLWRCFPLFVQSLARLGKTSLTARLNALGVGDFWAVRRSPRDVCL